MHGTAMSERLDTDTDAAGNLIPASLHKVHEPPELLLRTEHSLCPGCGEPITAIGSNNAVFGETGGHMTATTVLGQHTKTTVGGRDRERHGSPIKIAELVAQMDGTVYAARAATHTASAIKLTKQYLHDAF